jgi:hypothetical protein
MMNVSVPEADEVESEPRNQDLGGFAVLDREDPHTCKAVLAWDAEYTLPGVPSRMTISRLYPVRNRFYGLAPYRHLLLRTEPEGQPSKLQSIRPVPGVFEGIEALAAMCQGEFLFFLPCQGLEPELRRQVRN